MVPEEFLGHVADLSGGHRPPGTMTDGSAASYDDWSGGYNPDSWLDRCIAETRRAVFPWHGIDISY